MHTDPETRFDVNARLDVEALTELFDNEQYSNVGAIGRLGLRIDARTRALTITCPRID